MDDNENNVEKLEEETQNEQLEKETQNEDAQNTKSINKVKLVIYIYDFIDGMQLYLFK